MFQVIWLSDENLVRLVGRSESYLSALSRAEIDASVPHFDWIVDMRGRLRSPEVDRESEKGHYLVVEACTYCGSIGGWELPATGKLDVCCAHCKK